MWLPVIFKSILFWNIYIVCRYSPPGATNPSIILSRIVIAKKYVRLSVAVCAHNFTMAAQSGSLHINYTFMCISPAYLCPISTGQNMPTSDNPLASVVNNQSVCGASPVYVVITIVGTWVVAVTAGTANCSSKRLLLFAFVLQYATQADRVFIACHDTRVCDKAVWDLLMIQLLVFNFNS